MSQKVKLPKAVCDALDMATDEFTKPYIISQMVLRDDHRIPDIITERLLDEIMRALVLGYEPELTPKEHIKKKFFDNSWKSRSEYRCYQMGIKDALRIHGIKYDWLEGDAE